MEKGGGEAEAGDNDFRESNQTKPKRTPLSRVQVKSGRGNKDNLLITEISSLVLFCLGQVAIIIFPPTRG